ncbi:MAG TPA: hypothetical protein VF047_05850 [Nitrososphaeraceae archaeon]
MISCLEHQNFFDDKCEICKKEYLFIKGLEEKGTIIVTKDVTANKAKQFLYKDFTEEKAKKLYEKLFLYYLKTLKDEKDASNKAKAIIIKQCQIRNMEPWAWI